VGKKKKKGKNLKITGACTNRNGNGGGDRLHQKETPTFGEGMKIGTLREKGEINIGRKGGKKSRSRTKKR